LMQQLTQIRALAFAVCCVAALALAPPAFAQYGGVVVGSGGYYGYPGWYGGYYPWRWGGPGPYFATSPYYYSPYWYGGNPYVGYTYPAWGPAPVQYQNVAPPGAARNRSAAQTQLELMVYPKNGQSEYQQVKDRYECYRWAVSQLGYDPTSAGSPTAPRDLTDYNRAQTACLTARGYSVK
jgi:hypothetical protein